MEFVNIIWLDQRMVVQAGQWHLTAFVYRQSSRILHASDRRLVRQMRMGVGRLSWNFHRSRKTHQHLCWDMIWISCSPLLPRSQERDDFVSPGSAASSLWFPLKPGAWVGGHFVLSLLLQHSRWFLGMFILRHFLLLISWMQSQIHNLRYAIMLVTQRKRRVCLSRNLPYRTGWIVVTPVSKDLNWPRSVWLSVVFKISPVLLCAGPEPSSV